MIGPADRAPANGGITRPVTMRAKLTLVAMHIISAIAVAETLVSLGR